MHWWGGSWQPVDGLLLADRYSFPALCCCEPWRTDTAFFFAFQLRFQPADVKHLSICSQQMPVLCNECVFPFPGKQANVADKWKTFPGKPSTAQTHLNCLFFPPLHKTGYFDFFCFCSHRVVFPVARNCHQPPPLCVIVKYE